MKDVFILEGGLPKWRAEKRPVADVVKQRSAGRFVAQLDHSAVKTYDEMRKLVGKSSVEIVDARSEGRWRGVEPEPRPHLQSGRMPGSKNVPFPILIDEQERLKSIDEVRQCFVDAGVDLEKPIITSCGSGATAAILSLALDTIGQTNLSLYDGSWTEWASRQDSPIETD